MRCPSCGADDDKVLDTRSRNEGRSVRRKRECLKCGRRFFTLEEVEDKTLSVIKRDGRREPYDRNKLLRSMRLACTKRPVSIDAIERIADDIEAGLDFGYEIESREIGESVIRALRSLDDVAYVRFASVYRHFTDATDFMKEIRDLLESRKDADTDA
jgi:transcriptional repressor NrdR